MGEDKSAASGAALVGPIWFIGWLFTLGFAPVTFWQGLLALLIWPYYLGSALGM